MIISALALSWRFFQLSDLSWWNSNDGAPHSETLGLGFGHVARIMKSRDQKDLLWVRQGTRSGTWNVDAASGVRQGEQGQVWRRQRAMLKETQDLAPGWGEGQKQRLSSTDSMLGWLPLLWRTQGRVRPTHPSPATPAGTEWCLLFWSFLEAGLG